MSVIYLIGFMGSGKSTVGAYLKETYQLSSVDTDEWIEKYYQKSIPSIFAEEGEEQFRQYEIEALRSIHGYDVIATGGGIVERDENYSTMHANGTIVYLQASFKEIMTRLQHDASRPLWKDQDIGKREKLYNRRHTLYTSFADVVIHTDQKTIAAIGEKIIGLVQEE